MTKIGINTLFKFNKSALALVVSSSFLLMACDNDDDKSSNSDPVAFNLSVSDAPVDNASEVVVCFSEITLKKDGEVIQLPLKTNDDVVQPVGAYECLDADGMPINENLAINLLGAQGSESIEISETIDVEPGEYQMRVAVPDFSGSYVMTDEDGDGTDEKVLVEVPSEELKFSKFTVTQGGAANFTLEFDLRKSMNIPNKEGAAWHLKPNGVRLIDNNEAGHIAGIVSESLLCTDESGIETPTFVYLYVGSESDASLLGDMHYNEQGAYIGDGIEPLASTEVLTEVQSDGSYEIGFVATGEHTLALTCSDDIPDVADVMNFTNLQLLTVEKGNNELSFTE
ncbi:DUF4382 domain-containing protein [Thalassotalea nanhaiensis]|uniref:DUF4382 domain-containing protein n=1 Tax=Thalassotalea nanhaiensis TaxID=3065648 RepID=A0ABY9TMX7_9GAMM|nr:DUF4382 domain-containing protein [Colwelliaceae bacterium SQ345]